MVGNVFFHWIGLLVLICPRLAAWNGREKFLFSYKKIWPGKHLSKLGLRSQTRKLNTLRFWFYYQTSFPTFFFPEVNLVFVLGLQSILGTPRFCPTSYTRRRFVSYSMISTVRETRLIFCADNSSRGVLLTLSLIYSTIRVYCETKRIKK